MLSILPVLAGAFYVGAADFDYEQMIEITDVQAIKAAKKWEIGVTFNLIPDMPKGVKIMFTLQRTSTNQDVESFPFILEDENRKNIKVKFTPRVRVSVENYQLKTEIPPDQIAEVQRAFEAKPKRFPAADAPWPWNHAYKKFMIGTEKDEELERKEVKKYVLEKMGKIRELDDEAAAELEKAKDGKAYVKKDKTVNVEALRKFLVDWAKRLAAEQQVLKEADDFITSKYYEVYLHLLDLSRMVAKRYYLKNGDTAAFLRKQQMKIEDLKLPTIEGFDFSYIYKVSSESIKDKCGKISSLLEFKSPDEALKPSEGKAEGAPDSKAEPKKKEKTGESDSTTEEGGKKAGGSDVSETDSPKEEKPAKAEGKKKESPKKKKTGKSS